MNSERNIVNKLFESKYKELEEAGFDAKGSHYSCAFGHYTKDGEPISREEYFKAKGETVKGSDTPASKKGGNGGGGSGDGEGPKSGKASAYELTKKFMDPDEEPISVDEYFKDLLEHPEDYGYETEEAIDNLKQEKAYVKSVLGDDAVMLSEDGNNVEDHSGFNEFIQQCKAIDTVQVETGIARQTLQHPSGAKLVRCTNWGWDVVYVANPNAVDAPETPKKVDPIDRMNKEMERLSKSVSEENYLGGRKTHPLTPNACTLSTYEEAANIMKKKKLKTEEDVRKYMDKQVEEVKKNLRKDDRKHYQRAMDIHDEIVTLLSVMEPDAVKNRQGSTHLWKVAKPTSPYSFTRIEKSVKSEK
jgi:hypothetical protein